MNTADLSLQLRRCLCFALITCIASLAVRAQSSVTVGPTTYVSGQTQIVNATLTVQTQQPQNGIVAPVVVSPGAKITYSAGLSVTLWPGFHALLGSQFHASVDSDGDGIPDAWESTHGLNPHDATDALHVDSNGRPFLLLYQLGLEPSHASQSSPSQTQLNVHEPQ